MYIPFFCFYSFFIYIFLDSWFFWLPISFYLYIRSILIYLVSFFYFYIFLDSWFTWFPIYSYLYIPSFLIYLVSIFFYLYIPWFLIYLVFIMFLFIYLIYLFSILYQIINFLILYFLGFYSFLFIALYSPLLRRIALTIRWHSKMKVFVKLVWIFCILLLLFTFKNHSLSWFLDVAKRLLKDNRAVKA